MSDMRQPCPETSFLAAWLDGTLSPEERAEGTSHLAACDDCRRAVAIAASVPPQAGGQVDEALLARVTASGRRRSRARVWAAAAAALIAAGVAFWAARPSPQAPAEPEIVAQPPPPAVAAPEPRRIPLPDPPPAPDAAAKPDPRPAEAPKPPRPPVPGLPEEPRETVVKDDKPETPERKDEPALVAKPAPGPTTTDLSRVYTPVFVLDSTPDLWLRRGDAAAARPGTVERVAWQDTFSAPQAGAGFALEGKASVALDQGSQATVSRYHDAYALHLVQGAALLDTEGTVQRWQFTHGKARLEVPSVSGRLALEPRSDGSLAALLLEGRAEFRLGADVQKGAPGREFLAPHEGPLASGPGDPRKFTRLVDFRPRYVTAFTAGFDEKEGQDAPFGYTILSGRRQEEAKWAYLQAEGADAAKPGERALYAAAIRPEVPIVHSTGMMLCFRYRTDLGQITIKLGKFTAVHTSSTRAGQWGEAKIPLESFQEEGVRMVPSDQVTDVQFLGSAAYDKKGGKLDIDGVQFLRRAR
jgi:outer membrane biosynthesis protein TonB